VPDIFLSYSRDDQARAKLFAEAFVREGFDVWWDAGLRAGEAYDAVTERALREAKAVVVLWSPRSVESRWVRAEATLALRNRTLVPATIEACDRPIMFELTHTAELAGWRGDAADPAFRGFIADIRGFIARGGAAGEPGADKVDSPASVMPATPPRKAPFSRRTVAVSALGALALALVAAVIAWRSSPTDRPLAPNDPSVAVLAFANLSEEADNEYFAEGISEELINVLAKVPGLKVTARTSAFSFKGKDIPIPEIARQLGVAYIVEGSVRRSGDTVRITAQLVKADDGFQAWNGAFTRELKDIFAVQDEIAGLVATKISPRLTRTAGVARQVDPEAFQLYLEGRALAARGGAGNLDRAIALFERALQRDPAFSLARAQQARAYIQMGRVGAMRPKQAWAAARAALAPALAADPDSPEVLIAHGMLLRLDDWKWREAERAFETAMTLHPGDAEVIVSAGVLKAGMGRRTEALDLARRALELDPLNSTAQVDIGLIYNFIGDPADAERRFRRAIELSPEMPRYRYFLAQLLARHGQAETLKRLSNEEPDPLAKLLIDQIAAFHRGDRRQADAIAAEVATMRAKMGEIHDWPSAVASYLVDAGDLDGAMAELEKARDRHESAITWIKAWRQLSPLHSHPRWPAFLRSVGLSDEQLAEPVR
jgi:serine/threonine-protein kinase